MDRFFVKPALVDRANPAADQAGERLKVRKPSGGHLAAAGEFVPRDSYWLRRLADCDVVEAEPPVETKPAAKRA